MEDAQAICQRMANIRQDMDHSVEEVVENARELFDWRNVVRSYPWAIVASSVAVGYLLVPRRTQALRPETLAVAQMMEGRPVDAKVKTKPRSRILAPVATAIASAVMRTAVAAAAQYATTLLHPETSGEPHPREPRRSA